MLGLVVGSALSVVMYAEPAMAEPSLIACAPAVPAPTLTAQAAIALDVSSGTVFFEKNSLTQLPLASLTKLMTALLALEARTPDGIVVIDRDALSPEGASGLRVGESWRVVDLAGFTLTESSNDGARALMLGSLEALGVSAPEFPEVMNKRARALGMGQTYFLNETGLDVSSTTAGAYGSARDIAIMLAHTAHTRGLIGLSTSPEQTFYSLEGHTHTAKNTSLLAASYASSLVSKTGFTDLAGGNLAFMYEPIPGRPLALVVLGSTRDERERDVATLANVSTALLKQSLVCTSHD
jgi:D-alanyl-D-alanine carboxypeptidase